MTSDEWRQLGKAFGLPMVSSVLTHSAEEAAAAATTVGLPVAAKLSAPTIVHKSEVDGVRLNLTTPEAVRGAFDGLIAAGRQHGLSDETMSVLIQPMILGGTEMIVGLVEDPLFGPLVGLGPGGVLVEALGAVHFRIAPLTDRDADDLVAEVRRTKLLDGYRGRPRGDVDALTELVLRVSRLAEEIPEIIELDLNPVIVMPAGQGCRIVDARVKVGGGK
jgi:acyl-CoA synthetase (NDP forming)